MDSNWNTIEELARTSDESAVRRRFDRRNRVWLNALLVFFAFVSLIEASADTDRKTLFQIVIGVVNLVFVATTMFLAWSPSTRDWTRRRISAVAIGFVTVQYALALLYQYGDISTKRAEWVAWASTMPFMMVAFRMLPTELVLLHGILTSGGLLMLSTSMKNKPQVGLAIVTINIVTLAVGLFFSRRMRREVVGELTERRTHAREQIRMRDELHYARELQLSMLPDCAPSLPWADICGVSVPATEVGGDYYDYFVEGERVALVCGDVAGHGMAAGLVLSALRSGFTLLRDSLHDPAAVLRRLHDLVAQTSRRRMLVTVSVVLLDHVARRAIVASAGHPPVLLRRADGRVESIDLFAPPLGVRLPVDIPQRTIDVAPGDLFVLHSDGVYETRSAGGTYYGMERLEDVVRLRGGGSAEELRDAIVRDVTAFRGSEEAADDVTVVVCRVL
ncbi:MAG TPA: PP2C family protein-serine/threonine phosphatase [Thermoanaerobaculia bacterium]|nr:PP2C family protein-serine/threonine phosphatase [Thermoanaerobaculia bacterium]